MNNTQQYNNEQEDRRVLNKLDKELNKLQSKLLDIAYNNGIYENFGQKEVFYLKDKYIPLFHNYTYESQARQRIASFESWAMNQ